MHIRFFNPYLAFLMSQRAYLYGLPLAMLMITLLVAAARRRSTRWFVVAGVVGGLLPLAHLPTLLAMAMTVPFLALLLASRPWRDPLHRIPWTGWIVFGLVWVAVVDPAAAHPAGRRRRAPCRPSAPARLGRRAGRVVVVLGQEPRPVHPARRHRPGRAAGRCRRRSNRVLLALMVIFVVANLAVFQPWDWDNHKILVYWFLGLDDRGRCPARPRLATAIAGSPCASWSPWRSPRWSLSPLLENLDQLEGHMRYRMLEAEQVEMAERLRDATEPDALVVAGMQSHDPVMMLSGRQVLMGYWGQLWVSGIPYEERQREVGEIYKLSAEGDSLIREYGVDYVVIGPDERASLGANEDAYAARFPVAVATDRWRVYDVRSLTASAAP